MHVQILEQSWEYGNDEAEVDRLFEEIEAFLHQRGLHLSTMRIGPNEIYEDFKDYIVEHIDDIEKVEVVAYTIEEMAHQILLSTEQYLERALPPLQQLPKEFYQGATNDSWDSLAQAADGIHWIYQTVHSIVQAETDSIDRPKYKNIIDKLEGTLPDLIKSVEAKDPVAIADALTYEILPAIKDLYELIKTTIDDKVVRPHVS